MANTTSQSQKGPKRVRGKSERARGLDPEFTAQPRPVSSDLEAVGSDEAGLSVDPEDLGSHFLHEAVEQGDGIARDAAVPSMSIIEDPEREGEDEVLADGTETEVSVWNRMVDLAVHGGGGDQLRDAAAFGADALEAQREMPDSGEIDSAPVRVTDSSIREASLMDREGPIPGETVSPEVDLDDTGRHTRLTPREALGEQVRGAMEHAKKRTKPKRATGVKATIRKAAGKLHDLADRVAHAKHH